MDIIDEDGNLFGKVNLIDAIVILLLAAVILAGISFVWTSGAADDNEENPKQVTETPELENTERTIIFRATGQPDYVVNSLEEGRIPRSGIISIEEITVKRTSGGNTIFAKILLNATIASNGSVLWRENQLYVGRATTLGLDSVRLRGTIIDIGESASLPTFATSTPSPTPTPIPNEVRQVIHVQTTVPDYVADAIKEGRVTASTDIIAVREKTVSVVNESRNRYKIDLAVEIVARENYNQQLMYRGERLVVARNLRLDLGEAIVNVTVTNVRE